MEPQPASAALALLSFTGHATANAPARRTDGNLLVRFFVQTPSEAHIWVRERENRTSSSMRPERTRWTGGWMAFGPWPRTVVDALGVRDTDLAITITDHATPDLARTVFPAVMAREETVAPLEEYRIIVRSDVGLAPFNWRIASDAAASRNLPAGFAKTLSATIPYTVVIPTATLLRGQYPITFSGELVSDPSKMAFKTYRFFHEPQPGGAGGVRLRDSR